MLKLAFAKKLEKTMALTNPQKKYLRSLAHAIKPIILIGQNGLSSSVIEELTQTLKHHELLKIKIKAEDKTQKQHIIERIISLSQSELVQVVGGILVVYRTFEKNPEIILPK